MAAVGIADAAGYVVVFGEEKSGESGVSGVVTEEFVDGTQETLRVINGDGALAAKIGLQVGHEKSGSDAFAGDVADHETQAFLTEIEEVIIIAADVAGG